MSNSDLALLVREEGKLVSEVVVDDSLTTTKPEHEMLLQKVLGRDSIPRAPQPQLVEAAKMGFIWTVGYSFVSRLPFAATLYDWRSQWGGNVVETESGRDVIYSGDIPDFALHNIERAKRLHIVAFTIHSFLPLPISHGNVDPIVLGWFGYPFIRVDSGRRFARMGGIEENAIVVAVWNNADEVEI